MFGMEAHEIEAMRLALGWSRARLADYLAVTETSVTRYEKHGARHGSVVKLLRQLANTPAVKRGLQAAE